MYSHRLHLIDRSVERNQRDLVDQLLIIVRHHKFADVIKIT